MPGWDITDLGELCDTAQTLADDAWLTAAQWVQIVIGTATIALSVYIIAKGLITSLPMHANLKIVGANVLVLYCLVCIPQIVMNVWYQVMFRVYRDPCDLLIPSWIGLVVQGPVAIYMISFPLWHVATCFERAWATFRAQTYEKTSYTYGIICSVAVWSISLAYCAWVVYLATQDVHFFDISYYIVLTKSTNTELLLGSSYAMLVIDACSCVADGLLLYLNRKKLAR